MNSTIKILPICNWTPPNAPLILDKYRVEVKEVSVNFENTNVVFRVACFRKESPNGRIVLVPVSLFDLCCMLERDDDYRWDYVKWRAASYYERTLTDE